MYKTGCFLLMYLINNTTVHTNTTVNAMPSILTLSWTNQINSIFAAILRINIELEQNQTQKDVRLRT